MLKFKLDLSRFFVPRPKTGSPWAALVCVAQRTSNIRSGCAGSSSGQMATQSSPSGSDGVSAEPTTKKKKRKKNNKKTASGMWHTRGGGLLCLLLSASPTGAPRSTRTSKGLRATLRSACGALEVAEAHLEEGQQQPLRPAPPRRTRRSTMGGGVSAYRRADGSGDDEREKARFEALLPGYGAGGPPAVDLSGGLGSHSLKRALLRAGSTRVGSKNAYSLKMRRLTSSMGSSRVLGKALHEVRAGRALCSQRLVRLLSGIQNDGQ